MGKSTLTLCTFAVALVFLAMPAQGQNNQIELHQKFLSPLKYSYSDQEPASIYTFSGLGFKPGFEDVLSQNPAAMDAAKKSFSGNGLALVGGIVTVAGSAIMLSNTIKDSQNINNGIISNNSSDTTPLVLMVGGVIVSAIGTSQAKKHLRRGIAIFNEGATQAALTGEPPPVAVTIAPTPVGRRIGLGMQVRFNR